MIDWAFTAHLNVYISDGTEENRSLTVVKDTDDLYKSWDAFCWGKDRDTQTHRLLVISQEKLSQ